MQVLEFSVNSQIIVRTDNIKVVEKSKKYLYSKFSFSDDWKGVTKTAIFKSANGKAYTMILKNDFCEVPWEVIEKPIFYVSVFGGDLITANKVIVPVLESGYEKGETPQEPTPDVYQQILDSVKPPYIGDNGNWYIWDIETRGYVDSGYKSCGDIPETDIKNYIDEQTAILKADVEGIQEDIRNEAHFRGYVSTNADIELIEATPNDFVYSAESGTVWVYDAEQGWQETNTPVPDKATPLSNTTPLINGEASAGQSEEGARSDHRHPTDTTRASVAELQSLQKNVNDKADKPFIVTVLTDSEGNVTTADCDYWGIWNAYREGRNVVVIQGDVEYPPNTPPHVTHIFTLTYIDEWSASFVRTSIGIYNYTYHINCDKELGWQYGYSTMASKKYVDEIKSNTETALDNKSDKPIIVNISEPTYNFEFSNLENRVIRMGNAGNISFTFGDGEYSNIYMSSLSFDSGETPTAIDYTGSGILNWVGVDCANNDGLSIFQPSANKHYDIVFDFNGTQFIGLVNGFVPATGNVVSE